MVAIVKLNIPNVSLRNLLPRRRNILLDVLLDLRRGRVDHVLDLLHCDGAVLAVDDGDVDSDEYSNKEDKLD